MNYIKKASIACAGILGLYASEAKAQTSSPPLDKAAKTVHSIEKLHKAFQKETHRILRTNQTIYPMALPISERKNTRLSKNNKVFNIDFKLARNLPSDYEPSIPNMANFKMILDSAQDKKFVSYMNSAGKHVYFRTSNLKELFDYVYKDGTELYLNLNDNDEAYYLTTREKIDNYMPINQTVFLMSTGFLEKYDVNICQDGLKHEEAHGNGNNLLETTTYFHRTDSAAFQRYCEFKADSIALRARADTYSKEINPLTQGLVRLFADDLQDMRKDHACQSKELHEQKKFIKSNSTLQKNTVNYLTKEKQTELENLEKKYSVQQGFQHDAKDFHYTRAQRVYYLIVLGNLFNEEKRHGTGTPYAEALRKLLPQPYQANPPANAHQPPAFPKP